MNIYIRNKRVKVDHNVYIKTIFLGHPGGATPGKFLLGLRIYTCDQVKFPIRLFKLTFESHYSLPHL